MDAIEILGVRQQKTADANKGVIQPTATELMDVHPENELVGADAFEHVLGRENPAMLSASPR